MQLEATPEEQARRDEVMTRILDRIATNTRIKLPEFNPELDRPSDQYALQSVGIEPNEFSGTIGRFRYQFEGEEDLLHLIIAGRDELPVFAEEGQVVAGFVLNGVPPALIWLRPGEFTQHFYVGHDELVSKLVIASR